MKISQGGAFWAEGNLHKVPEMALPLHLQRTAREPVWQKWRVRGDRKKGVVGHEGKVVTGVRGRDGAGVDWQIIRGFVVRTLVLLEVRQEVTGGF